LAACMEEGHTEQGFFLHKYSGFPLQQFLQ